MAACSTIVSSHVTSVPVFVEFSPMRQLQTLPLTFHNASAMNRTRSNELTTQKPELIVRLRAIKEGRAGLKLRLARFRDMSRPCVTSKGAKNPP